MSQRWNRDVLKLSCLVQNFFQPCVRNCFIWCYILGAAEEGAASDCKFCTFVMIEKVLGIYREESECIASNC